MRTRYRTQAWRLGGLGLMLGLALLGCGWLSRTLPTPEPLPTPTAWIAPREALRQAAAQLQATGSVTLRLHESQATAYVQDLLAQQPDAPVREVAVYFREGHIMLYGTVDSPLGPLPAEIVVTPTVDAEGRVSLTVDSATLGGLTMPQDMLHDYLGQLESGLDAWAGQYAVDELTVADGWLVARAHRR